MLDEEQNSSESNWLSVIGRSLAYFALQAANRERKFNSVLDRVDFLEGLGLSVSDAANVAGTTKASVVELRRQRKGKKSGKGKTKNHSRR
jgi:hypothetical protein